VLSRSNALFVAGVALVLALVAIGYLGVLESETEPAAGEAPVVEATEQTHAARLGRADGSVEIRVGDAPWQPAQVGTRVAAGADVRTGPDGVAALSYGDGVNAEVRSGSMVRVDRLDDEVTRFVVGRGLVIIDVDEQKKKDRVVQLAAEGSDALVETRSGRVAVLNDGNGQVQTAVTRGEAMLSANGGTVKLGEGQQSLVAKDQPPSAPAEIPKSLLLKVKWPSGKTSKRRHRIQGTANPGALVRVGKQVIAADREGRFSAVVDLDEGRNRIVVRAVDVTGRAESAESPDITVDTEAPAATIDTHPDMWQEK
jgi:hypothetical protein